MFRTLPFLVFATACLPEFPKLDFTEDPAHDFDGDGLTELDGDCDDAEPLAYPGADEVCDGIDNDCDGDADEDDALDATLWYGDNDRDGYGSGDYVVFACDPPDGYAAQAGDCDETTAGINPGAQETCSGVDDDCDGMIDDEDDSMTGIKTWYRNADGDAYGDDDYTVDACEPPEGYVYDGGDCDDLDASVYPNAIEFCDGIDNDCDDLIDDADPGMMGEATWYADNDGDGYGDALGETIEQCAQPAGFVIDSADCDDSNSAINPDGAESCNEVDDDCDGVVDEGVTTTYFLDADSDGHGTDAVTMEACDLPEGFVANWTDCDDLDPATNPDASEVCDGVDNNCDDEIDEDAAIDAPVWYLDADADGFGDPATAHPACTAPADHIADNTDCDDFKDGVHPDQTETCFTAYDDNCDDDNNDIDATGCLTHYSDADLDGHGDPDDSICVCDDKGVYTTRETGDCDDSVSTTHEDAEELCSTPADDDCDGDTNDEGASGCTNYFYDWDGDGYGIIDNECLCEPRSYYEASVPGDCDDTDAGTHPGGTTECGLFGDVTADQATAMATPESINEYGGFSAAGDINGDGHADIIIGDHGYDNVTTDGTYIDAGAAFIWYGPVSGSLDTSSGSTADAIFKGTSASAECGFNVSGIGDMNDDVYQDIMVHCRGEGNAYILHGPFEGDYSVSDTVATVAANSRARGLGDINGDNRADIMVDGASTSGWYPEEYIGYIYYGSITGELGRDDADVTFGRSCCSEGNGAFNTDTVHNNAIAAGDMTGDGIDDYATAYANGLSWDDKVRVMQGTEDGPESLASFTVPGFDQVVAYGGDIDGDGYGELLIGCSRCDSYNEFSGTHSGGGKVFLILGANADDFSVYSTTTGEVAHAIFAGDSADDAVGIDLSSAGDVDGDGHGDILIGAASENEPPRLFYGPISSGTIEISSGDAKFPHFAGSDHSYVEPAGDTDDDGFGDFFLFDAHENALYLYSGQAN